MTTKTVRGVGRARHEANARHNQRTPLTPKTAPQKSPADLAAEDAERAEDVKPKRRTTGEVLADTRRAKVAQKATAKAPEATAPAAGAKRGGKTVQAKKAAAAAIPDDFPGAAKARRLLDGAAEAGWASAVALTKPATIVVSVSRGSETIVTTLTDNKLDLSEMPAYNDGARTVKLKNVSAVLAQMSGAKPTAKPVSTANAVRAPRRTRAQIATEDGGKSLPFDPEGATDEEVREAIRGRAIEWMNGISRKVEEATVLAYRMVRNPEAGKPGEPEKIERAAKIDIKPHPSRPTRVVTFADPFHTGVRSVALDRLLRVK